MKNKLPLFLISISVAAIVLFLVFYKTNSNFNWYLVRENVTLKVDEEKNIEINLDDNSKLKLSYKSLDETIATVDQNGLVHALKVGETNIIVSNNLDTRTLTYKVIVTD